MQGLRSGSGCFRCDIAIKVPTVTILEVCSKETNTFDKKDNRMAQLSVSTSGLGGSDLEGLGGVGDLGWAGLGCYNNKESEV